MAILKCKMCGGDLVFEPGATVCECEYCGSKQTIPNADNEKKMTLFTRANRLLRSCEFDKAEGIFSSIAAEFPEEAEAYWGLVLCKYGIEYVDDPATGKKVPTCHRSSFDSVMDDADFDQVMENADTVARAVYREQAKQIEGIRKGIIEVSGKEAPYDIFICYKETAEDGQRTIDSVLAQDVYDALTARGYRVFFSRISLEDKLGTEYEPYIFAALNSARVMLAFGTTYDYYNAVWVKNEWSRFLKLMTADKSKYLIPCYKDIDAYDIPKEFAKLQAQDLGKVGAVQDLIRGIEKLIGRKQILSGVSADTATEAVKQLRAILESGVGSDTNLVALLKRGNMALEDHDWYKADDFFEQVLNQDAECAEAYWGKLLITERVTNAQELGKSIFTNNIMKRKYERENVLKYDLVKIARETDGVVEVLQLFSDNELKKILSHDFEKPDYVFKDSLRYLERVRDSLKSIQDLGIYTQYSLFTRVLQYADTDIKDGIHKVYQLILDSLFAEIEKEKSRINKNHIDFRYSENIIKEKLTSRLSPIIEYYQNNKNVLEKEKKEALREEEERYSAAFSAWCNAKNNYSKNYEKAVEQKKGALDRIDHLEMEAKNYTGFFQMKRRREIEKSIAELKRQSEMISIPEEPGAEPKKKNNETILLSNCPLNIEFKDKVIFALSTKERMIHEQFINFQEQIRKASVGNTVMFGRYPFTEKGDVEPIEWVVLQVIDKKYVWLKAKHILDGCNFSYKGKNALWNNSNLRSWLNIEFIDKAFTSKELENVKRFNELPINPKKIMPPPQPSDRVYPLSAGELMLTTVSQTPTPYVAKKLKAYRDWYWLRNCVSSPVGTVEPACVMGTKVSYTYPDLNIGVCPTLWVSVPTKEDK